MRSFIRHFRNSNLFNGEKNVFALILKVFEILGLSIERQNLSYEVFRMVSLLICFLNEIFKTWDLIHQIHPFNADGFIENFGKNLMLLIGIMKYILIVSLDPNFCCIERPL